jgi:hypothetical protein
MRAVEFVTEGDVQVWPSITDAYKAAQRTGKKVVRSEGGYFKVVDLDAPGQALRPVSEPPELLDLRKNLKLKLDKLEQEIDLISSRTPRDWQTINQMRRDATELRNKIRRKVEVGPVAEDEQLDELTFKGSPCTVDCSGHRAGYEWYQRKRRTPNSWSPSFNNGAAIAAAGK